MEIYERVFLGDLQDLERTECTAVLSSRVGNQTNYTPKKCFRFKFFAVSPGFINIYFREQELGPLIRLTTLLQFIQFATQLDSIRRKKVDLQSGRLPDDRLTDGIPADS